MAGERGEQGVVCSVYCTEKSFILWDEKSSIERRSAVLAAQCIPDGPELCISKFCVMFICCNFKMERNQMEESGLGESMEGLSSQLY